jgi:hypothetical protein
MPSVSESQRRLFGAALACARRKGKCRGGAARIADRVPEEKIREFARKPLGKAIKHQLVLHADNGKKHEVGPQHDTEEAAQSYETKLRPTLQRIFGPYAKHTVESRNNEPKDYLRDPHPGSRLGQRVHRDRLKEKGAQFGKAGPLNWAGSPAAFKPVTIHGVGVEQHKSGNHWGMHFSEGQGGPKKVSSPIANVTNFGKLGDNHHVGITTTSGSQYRTVATPQQFRNLNAAHSEPQSPTLQLNKPAMPTAPKTPAAPAPKRGFLGFGKALSPGDLDLPDPAGRHAGRYGTITVTGTRNKDKRGQKLYRVKGKIRDHTGQLSKIDNAHYTHVGAALFAHHVQHGDIYKDAFQRKLREKVAGSPVAKSLDAELACALNTEGHNMEKPIDKMRNAILLDAFLSATLRKGAIAPNIKRIAHANEARGSGQSLSPRAGKVSPATGSQDSAHASGGQDPGPSTVKPVKKTTPEPAHRSKPARAGRSKRMLETGLEEPTEHKIAKPGKAHI